MKVSPEWRQLSQLLAELGTPEWRWVWWQELEREQPAVAARLAKLHPDTYPVQAPNGN